MATPFASLATHKHGVEAHGCRLLGAELEGRSAPRAIHRQALVRVGALPPATRPQLVAEPRIVVVRARASSSSSSSSSSAAAATASRSLYAPGQRLSDTPRDVGASPPEDVGHRAAANLVELEVQGDEVHIQ